MDYTQSARDFSAPIRIRPMADIIYATGSHETLSAFLTTCGWSLEEVKAWYYEMACNQLLSEEARRGAGAGPESPTDGLSFGDLVSD